MGLPCATQRVTLRNRLHGACSSRPAVLLVLLEASLSRDRLSAILVPLILRLAYGSSPKMLIVDLTHLVSHEMDVLLRLWLAYSVDITTSRLRHRCKA